MKTSKMVVKKVNLQKSNSKYLFLMYFFSKLDLKKIMPN